MLRLLVGSGSAAEEIARAAANGVRKQILIVPQHASHEAERKLCSVCGDAVSLFCEVLTMKRMANRVFGEAGGLAEHTLDAGGRLLVMSLAARSVASALQAFAGQIRKPEFLKGLVAMIDECKTHGVSSARLAQAAEENKELLGEKIHDLALLYEAYEATLGQSRSDPADLLTKLAERMEESGYAVGKTVYIEGFTEFTPQEFRIVEVLMRKANNLTVFFGNDTANAAEHQAGSFADDAFYGQIKTAERLRRVARRLGIDCKTEHIEARDAAADGKRSDSLRFLEEKLFGLHNEGYDGECKEIELHTAETVWDECEQAACEVLRLCREKSYRFRDIVVAAPDYSLYAGTLEAVFEAWEIPLFSDRMDDILSRPVMAAVEAAVDAAIGGFEYGDMFRYLKTGLPGLDYDQCCRLENYVLAWNIRGKRWLSETDWSFHPKGFSASLDEEAGRELAELNQMKRTVMAPFRSLLRKVSPGKELPAAELIKAFYTFLTDAGIDRMILQKREEYLRRGDRKLAEEYAQLWGMICDALDTCMDILREMPMSFSEFGATFKLLLSTMKVGTIPVSADSVAAGDAGRLRHRDVRCVILLGAVNGAFPPPVVRNSLLTDENRSELLDCGIELEPPASQMQYREMEIAYSILTLPKDKLYISWPLSDRGAQRSPSYLIERIRAMFHLSVIPPMGDRRLTAAERPCLELALRAAGGADCSPEATAAFQYFQKIDRYRTQIAAARQAALSDRGCLSKESVRKLYGEQIRLTASRADKLRTCQYAFFLQYGLKTKPRLKAELDALESGNFLHYVLEGTVKTVMDRGGFKAVPIEEIRILADHLADDYAAEILGGLADKSARVRYLFRRLRRTALRVVENVSAELRVSDFTPLAYEMEFGGKSGIPGVTAGEGDERVELTGVVDRVDGWEKDGKLYLRVVDYKSGYKKFDLSDIWHGLSLQMLIYLFALEERGREIFGKETVGAGVLYIPVKDAVYSGSRGVQPDKIRDKTDDALRRSGLILKNIDVIEAMELGKPKRFIPVTYARGSDQYADAASLAGWEQLGKLKQHVDMLLRQMGKALHEGSVNADPYYRDLRTTACDYCDFAAACRFDASNGSDRMRWLYQVKPDEFWEKLEGNGNAD